jgi:hypothetical protein
MKAMADIRGTNGANVNILTNNPARVLPEGGVDAMISPKATHDLSPSERRFVVAMNELRFGRFEFLRIEHGKLVLDPWPAATRSFKFGNGHLAARKEVPNEFELKRHVAQFFERVRSIEAGEIRCLEVRHGLPFSMEVEHCQTQVCADRSRGSAAMPKRSSLKTSAH